MREGKGTEGGWGERGKCGMPCKMLDVRCKKWKTGGGGVG